MPDHVDRKQDDLKDAKSDLREARQTGTPQDLEQARKDQRDAKEDLRDARDKKN